MGSASTPVHPDTMDCVRQSSTSAQVGPLYILARSIFKNEHDAKGVHGPGGVAKGTR